MNVLAAKDPQPPSPVFGAHVKSLMDKAETVLVNTAQLKQHSDNPEVLIDLQCDIAKSYEGSPQLRFTWLER